MTPKEKGRAAVLERKDLQALVDVLTARGLSVYGPKIRDGSLVYERMDGTAELPEGWIDEQAPGSYRLAAGESGLFGPALGAQSWKRMLHPPRLRLWKARRKGQEVSIDGGPPVPEPLAFLGVRPCDLAAIRILDRVFTGGPYPDPLYRARRAGTFIVAANCSRAASTCFCASMGTGPRASEGFDLALTDIAGGGTKRWLVEAGTSPGAEVLDRLPARPPAGEELAAAGESIRKAAAEMSRTVDLAGLREGLQSNLEHGRWDEVAVRCLACGNCTMVCPTCFCITVEDRSDLAGAEAERTRLWDSCYSMEFSYIYGGNVRRTVRARYRQWLTHKLASWQDQFGEPGCVGCGRCITWCPAGIDITEEARAIRGAAGGTPAGREPEGPGSRPEY